MNPLKKSKRNFKRKVAKATGVPTTKSGRKKKLKATITDSNQNRQSRGKTGCRGLVFLILALIIVVYIFIGG